MAKDKYSIEVEVKKIGEGLEQVKAEMTALGNQVKVEGTKIRAETTRLQSGFNGVSSAVSSLKTILIGLGAAGVIRGIMNLITSTADAGDQFAKMSQRLGVSVETLSTFDHVAKLSGLTLEEVAVGLRRFAANALDMSRGIGEAKRDFEALKISVVDSRGKLKTVEQLILEVANRFSQMEDGTTKTAMAMNLFGRSGSEMIPMLNKGSAGLREMMEEAKRLGLVFTKEAAKAAEDFNDNLTRLKGTLKGIVYEIGTNLIPKLNEFFKIIHKDVTGRYVGDLADQYRQAISEIKEEIERVEKHLAGKTISSWILTEKDKEELRKRLSDLRAELRLYSQALKDLEGLRKPGPKIEIPPVPTKEAIEAAKRAEESRKYTEGLKDMYLAEQDLDEATRQTNKALEEQADALREVYDPWAATWNMLADEAEDAADRMGTAFGDFKEDLQWSLEAGLFDVFKDGFKDLESAAKSFLNMLTETFARAVAKMISEWIMFKSVTQITSLISSLFGGATAAAGAGAGGGTYWAENYQFGGLITEPIGGIGLKSGRSYLFGEAGPEAVIPARAFGGRQEIKTNIWLVDERPKAQHMGPDDVVLIVSEDIRGDGPIRKTIKRFI